MSTDVHGFFAHLFFYLSCPSQFRFSSRPLRIGLLILLFAFTAFAQELPDEIRGYKVYQAKIDVQTRPGKTKAKKPDAILKLGDPAEVNISTSGLTLEISAEIQTLGQSGRVDFLVFKDFRANGLALEIEDYNHAFPFEKNQTIKLPRPIKISLSFAGAALGAYSEWRQSKDLWQVSGRIFVFGRFKKAGFRFKRVIPLDVNLQIKNPLRVAGNW